MQTVGVPRERETSGLEIGWIPGKTGEPDAIDMVWWHELCFVWSIVCFVRICARPLGLLEVKALALDKEPDTTSLYASYAQEIHNRVVLVI